MTWESILRDLRPVEVPSEGTAEPHQSLTYALERLLQLSDRSAKLQFRSTEATGTTQRTLQELREWFETHVLEKQEQIESLRARLGDAEDELRRCSLGIMDLLDVTASAQAAARRERAEDAETWLERLGREELKIARRLGIEPSAAVGDDFNPELHEAVDMVEAEQPSRTIVEIVRQGYRHQAKVVRVAKVTVRL
jgi:molecular chaperone GrpE